jgi:hypothetical protein
MFIRVLWKIMLHCCCISRTDASVYVALLISETKHTGCVGGPHTLYSRETNGCDTVW